MTVRRPGQGAKETGSFDALLTDYATRFRHGTCELRPGERLRECLERDEVPNDPGVYVLEALRGDTVEVWYVGKAGILRPDGAFSEQGLAMRLCNRQDGTKRTVLFPRWLREHRLDGLRIRWFVTRSAERTVLPTKAEADLLQAYFDDHRKPPPENRTA